MNKIRKSAQIIGKVMNFCLNPTCLHADRAKGCACCARGHGKKTAKRSRR